MKIFRIASLLAFLAVIIAGCSESELVRPTVVEGLPATVKIRINFPAGNLVSPTRAPEKAESQIKNLKLIMFSEGGRREVVDLENYTLIAGTPGALADRQYTIEAKVDVTSGDYNTYIVANYNTKFNKWVSDNLNKATKEELENAIVEMAGAEVYDHTYINITDDDFIPMSGRKKIQIQPTDANSTDNTQTITFQVERIMSRIEFNFVVGKVTPDLEFTPLSYRVYNLPKKAAFFRELDASTEEKNNNYGKQALKELWGATGLAKADPTADDFFNVTEEQPITDNCFSFLMYENARGTKVTKEDGTPIDYHMRDKWTKKAESRSDGEGGDAYEYDEATTRAEATDVMIDPSTKEWTYAPEYSTFVVVKGTITVPSQGIDAKGYSGTIYYTIHLGNFGTGDDGNTGNFNVKRNEYHKYKVTINGIANFISEVAVGGTGGIEEQPGVEGVLTQSQNLFYLDAHYEQVMLKFTETEFQAFKSKSENMENAVSVKSPATDFNYMEYSQNELIGAHQDKNYIIDTHWLQFMKPDGSTTTEVIKGVSTQILCFPQFIGWQMDDRGEYILDPQSGHRQFREKRYDNGEPIKAGYITDFLTNPEDYCYHDEENHLWYTAVFIDEYAYNAEQAAVSRQYKLKEYVNVDNRSIIVNRSEKATSEDAQSAIYQYTLFEIQQRSIKTTLDLDIADALGGAYDDIFGIETWDETACYNRAWTGVWNRDTWSQWYNVPDGTPGVPAYAGYNDANLNLTVDRGRQNTITLHHYSTDNTLRYQSDGNYFNARGYSVPHDDNSAGAHTWTQRTDSPLRRNAMTAVLSRNRDLNGDGELNDFEIRWYLPAMEQYEAIWFGQQGLMQDTRLFEPKDFFDGDYLYNMDNRPKFFTSSGANNLIYWQDQGASVTKASQFGESWLGCYRHYVRACRNIPNYMVHAKFPASNYTYTTDKQNATGIRGVIVVDGIANTRDYEINESYPNGGYYGYHNERDPENYLYKAFEVSKEFGTFNISTYNANNMKPEQIAANMITTYQNAMASSTNNPVAASERYGWRIPNQRELMLLRHFGYLDKSKRYYCSTWFSEIESTRDGSSRTYSRHYPFAVNQDIFTLNANRITGTTMVFVRDYTKTPPKNPSNNESYDDGGTGFGVQ